LTPIGGTTLDAQHAAATEIFTSTLEACNIATAFDGRFRFEGTTLKRLATFGGEPENINLADFRKIFVIAMGKAAGPMLDVLLARMPRRQGLRGVCCSKYLPTKRNWRFRYFEGGHPLPNEESFAAARAALALLKKARKDTLVFFLISGGGSAMFDLPLDERIGLEETVAFHKELLGCGAPISDINVLRKHFSAVKGGRLAVAAPEARKISLLLPDVPLRSIDSLSSGPTSPDHSTLEDVRTVLTKYNLEDKLPRSVVQLLTTESSDIAQEGAHSKHALFSRTAIKDITRALQGDESSAEQTPEDPFRNSSFEILLSSQDLVENARRQAENAGFVVTVDNSCDDWNYVDAASYLLERFHFLRKNHERFCLISVGEVVVTLNQNPGAGGRNQQFALECARELARFPGEQITVLSAGSDGIDGNTKNAGAIADTTTFERARAFGFDPEESLRNFDACPLFTALGDTLVTGPTGQNLRDLRLFLSERDSIS
jgi:glycerate 2-kinase